MIKGAILLEHGAGGRLMNELIQNSIVPAFKNEYLEQMGDSAVFEIGSERLCFTTDSYTVDPVFFPGGDIGSLSIHGTVNDISVCGGRPLFIGAGIILEEGFPLESLERIISSMARAASACGVIVATGDTKVVPRGKADGIYINTSGIGVVEYPGTIAASSIRKGDAVIVSGTIGDHGAAILSTRSELGLSNQLRSDSAPVNDLVQAVMKASSGIRFMRDPTRGGLGAVLVEAANASGLTFDVDETTIPVKEEVRALCEIVGLDPLFLACEGRVLVVCEPQDTEKVVSVMRTHLLGRDAAIIGRVCAGKRPGVTMRTSTGGYRAIDLPEGELVPRIC